MAEIPLPMWIYDLATLRICAVNEAASIAYGYSRAEFLALTADRLRPREDRQDFAAYLERGAVLPSRHRARHVTRDGQVVSVDVVADPVTRDGRPARRVIVVDATARLEIEDECSRLTQAVEQAAESIIITDPQGTIVYVNPSFERVTGYRRAEVMGANPRLLQSGRQDAAFYQAMWAALSQGEVWRGRLVNRRKDGTLFEEEATISSVRSEGGAIVSYVAVKRDVSRETSLEEQVRHSVKMEAVGRLAGGVAHDFNNLLNVISGYAELGLRRLPPESDARRHVGEILRAAERAATLTRQLLTFSRRQVVPPRVIDLNAIVADMDGLIRRLIGEDVDLTTRPSPETLIVRVDPGQMEQVLMNLAVNARDAMPGGGRLVVETALVELDAGSVGDLPPGRYAALTVRDTGCGMDAETASRIFEPFFTTKAEGKGTGLGLSTVWGIVKQSGGTVTVESRPGLGTAFRVLLPQVDGPGREAIASPDTGAHDRPRPGTAPGRQRGAAPAAAPEGRTVLVVDDEASLRAIVRDVLEEAGYRVLEAADAAEAIRAAGPAASSVDLVLTDVNLPGRGGVALVQELKAMRSELPVVVMSGATEGQGSGLPAAFLSKPFTSQALEQTIREALAALPS